MSNLYTSHRSISLIPSVYRITISTYDGQFHLKLWITSIWTGVEDLWANLVQVDMHLLKRDICFAMETMFWAHGALYLLVDRENQEANVLSTLVALDFTVTGL